jgi:predicted nucleic acid-binding protein
LASVIVLDASVLIAHLDATDARHDRVTTLLTDAADEPLGISPLTLAEVLIGPASAGKLDVAESAIDDLEVIAVPFADNAPTRLAVLRATTGLRMPDCCVLLAAESAHAQPAAFDDRSAKAAPPWDRGSEPDPGLDSRRSRLGGDATGPLHRCETGEVRRDVRKG